MTPLVIRFRHITLVLEQTRIAINNGSEFVPRCMSFFDFYPNYSFLKKGVKQLTVKSRNIGTN